jgi:hypothetical protein
MKKKLLFVSILSIMIMLGMNINVYASCNYGCRGDNGGMGPPCTNRNQNSCGSPPGCTWKCVSCTNSSETYNSSGNGSCTCPTPAKPKVTDGCTGKYSSDGEGCTMTANGSGTLSCSSGNTSMATVSMTGNTCTVTAVGSPKTDTCTQDVTITITSTNGCNNSSSSTGDVTVMTPWGAGTSNTKVWVEANTKIDKKTAEAKGYGVAYECPSEKTSGGYWLCTKYTRGCGKKPPNPEPHCYKKDDLLYWGIYSKVTDGKEIIDSGYTLVSSIDDPKKCVSQFKCSTTEPSGSTSTTCNGQGNIEGTYKRKCEAIYTIECKDNIYTQFLGPVYDWSLESKNSAYLYPGTGFKYKFTAFSDFTCEGKFDKSRYDKVEKYIKEYASKVGGDIVSLNGKFYSSALEGLEYIRDSYTKWDPSYDDKSKVIINDKLGNKTFTTVTLNGVEGSGFILVEPTCGKLPKDKSGSDKLKNFHYEEKHYLEKEMPMAYLNNKGKIVYGNYNCSDCDLGKKFFVTDNREYIGADNYNYYVNATGLGYHGFASDSTKCNIQLVDNGIIYRHIDPNDPFLKGTSHKIGINWLNSKYDFTRIIKASTWKNEPMYNVIRLSQDINQKIKSETSGNPNYYIGACTRGTASNSDTICQLLKKSQK